MDSVAATYIRKAVNRERKGKQLVVSRNYVITDYTKGKKKKRF